MVYLFVILLQLILIFIISRFLIKTLSKFIFNLGLTEGFYVYFISFFFILGTTIHEFSHLIAAHILGVKTYELNLLPVKEEGRIKLGSLKIAKTDQFRRLLIGIAPIFVGVFILVATTYFAQYGLSYKENLIYVIIGFFIVFQVSNTMYSSSKDLEGSAVFIIVLFFILAILYLIGYLDSILSNNSAIEALSLFVNGLNLVIVIDLLMLIFFGILVYLFKKS